MPYLREGSPLLYDEATDRVIGVKNADGTESIFGNPPGRLVSGRWVSPPSLFRLRLVGTGVVEVYAKDGLGTVTNVASLSAIGAINQIEFPYLGDAAVDMLCVFPNTVSVEVL